MSLVSGCVLGLLLFGADPTAEIRLDSALLTLMEHADVSAGEMGLLSSIEVKEGEMVEEGKPLARIDDRDAKLINSRTEFELKMAQTSADNNVKTRFAKLSSSVASGDLLRAMQSNSELPKSVSQAEIDRLKLLVDKAGLEIEQAEVEQQQATLTLKIKQQEFDRSKLALERRTIIAPFSGMVVRWKKHRGEWVEPGMPVIRLIRLDRLRAEAFVASHKLPLDVVGKSVTFVTTHSVKGSIKCTGKLAFVSPEIDPVNSQVRIWAEIENDDFSLRPGQTGTLTINTVTKVKDVIKPQPAKNP